MCACVRACSSACGKRSEQLNGASECVSGVGGASRHLECEDGELQECRCLCTIEATLWLRVRGSIQTRGRVFHVVLLAIAKTMTVYVTAVSHVTTGSECSALSMAWMVISSGVGPVE